MPEQAERRAPWLIGLALVYLLAEFLALHLPDHLPFLEAAPDGKHHWGWSNKAVGIVFSALLLVVSPWLRQNVGFRWRQAPGSLRWSLIIF
jgi:uncharacterized membrane protein YhdT